MCAKKIEGLEILAKAAPNAKIELTVAQLRQIFRNLGSVEVPEVTAPAAPVMPRGTKTPTSREVFKQIFTLWPKARVTELSRSLGVSRAWIYHLMKDVLLDIRNPERSNNPDSGDSEEPQTTEEPAPEELPEMPELAIIELQEPATLKDYADIFDQLINPKTNPEK